MDLINTILKIIRHTKINKKNKKDMMNALAMVVQQKQAIQEICRNQKCINQENIVYYND